MAVSSDDLRLWSPGSAVHPLMQGWECQGIPCFEGVNRKRVKHGVSDFLSDSHFIDSHLPMMPISILKAKNCSSFMQLRIFQRKSTDIFISTRSLVQGFAEVRLRSCQSFHPVVKSHLLRRHGRCPCCACRIYPRDRRQFAVWVRLPCGQVGGFAIHVCWRTSSFPRQSWSSRFVEIVLSGLVQIGLWHFAAADFWDYIAI